MARSAVLDGNRWVTDGGLETDLTFNHGVDLPGFAAFPLLEDPAGEALLREYYVAYAAVAAASNAGFLVETPTWRANRDWGEGLGFSAADLDRVNRAAVTWARSVARDCGIDRTLVTGIVGPRGDGYRAAGAAADDAASYHAAQIASFAAAGADLIHAMTLTEAAEAIGVVRAARAAGLPVAISFTVETDGALPDGSSLREGIEAVEAASPADWYGVNCAHPSHVLRGLDGAGWQERLVFFRPNASTLSHQELDEMEVLDAGDIDLLVSSTRALRERLPSIAVLGGCCGTDSSHVAALWAD